MPTNECRLPISRTTTGGAADVAAGTIRWRGPSNRTASTGRRASPDGVGGRLTSPPTPKSASKMVPSGARRRLPALRSRCGESRQQSVRREGLGREGLGAQPGLCLPSCLVCEEATSLYSMRSSIGYAHARSHWHAGRRALRGLVVPRPLLRPRRESRPRRLDDVDAAEAIGSASSMPASDPPSTSGVTIATRA